MFQWSVDAALNSRCFDEVWLSTDDEDILELGTQINGVQIDPRPAELATGSVKGTEVLTYTIEKARNTSPNLEYFCLLLPTSPFRGGEIINHAMTILKQEKWDFVVGIQAFHVSPVYTVDNRNGLHPKNAELTGNRHNTDVHQPAFHLAGGIFAGRIDTFLQQGHFYGNKTYGLELDPISAWDIDTEQEWQAAEIIASGLPSLHVERTAT